VGSPPRRRPRPEIARISRVLDRLAGIHDIDRFVGFHGRDPFRVLIGCVLSLRTRDDVSFPATERLFARARTPRAMLRLEASEIARLIYPAGFFRRKAVQIREISRRLLDDHGGRVPETLEALTELPGVGRKTANLVVTLGFGLPGICVDVHVHRISNRLGWVRTGTPDETEFALREFLPARHWIPINETLVRHGQSICHPTSPWCSRCPVAAECPREGVARSR
jgi:endonuclease-3